MLYWPSRDRVITFAGIENIFTSEGSNEVYELVIP